MSRSKWKKPFQDINILLIIQSDSDIKELKTMCRSSVISKFFINKNILVHTGNAFKNIFITEQHLGYKFGDFAFTRKINNIKKKTILKHKIIKKKK
jgi:small subunit ribosomal protein S19